MNSSNIKLSEESLRQFIVNSLSVVKDKSLVSFSRIPLEQIPLEVISSFIKEDISLNYSDDFSGTIHYRVGSVWNLEVTQINSNKELIITVL